jgi:hypothetical protein
MKSEHFRCEFCVWFDTRGHDLSTGRCRFVAPLMVKGDKHGYWPRVDLDDWCSNLTFDLREDIK